MARNGENRKNSNERIKQVAWQIVGKLIIASIGIAIVSTLIGWGYDLYFNQYETVTIEPWFGWGEDYTYKNRNEWGIVLMVLGGIAGLAIAALWIFIYLGLRRDNIELALIDEKISLYEERKKAQEGHIEATIARYPELERQRLESFDQVTLLAFVANLPPDKIDRVLLQQLQELKGLEDSVFGLKRHKIELKGEIRFFDALCPLWWKL